MHWFIANAPIRLKLLIAFGMMTCLVAVEPLTVILAGKGAAILTGAVATFVAICLAWWFRGAIAGPYVRTVVRMEALAAGDLDSPIAHTDFRDCVGRMTTAMFTFRDNARAQIGLNKEAERNAVIVRGMTNNLERLANGDLTADIVEDYPSSYARLRDGFNTALSSLRDLVGAVSDGAHRIDGGAHEIARASHDLARPRPTHRGQCCQPRAKLGGAYPDGRSVTPGCRGRYAHGQAR